MPKLTAIGVANYVAHASKRREIRDALSPLTLIIQPKPKGTKSWAMRFRRPDGRPAKLTLGRVDLSDQEPDGEPTLGGALTLHQARVLAAKIANERARKIDVIDHYKAKALRAAAASADRAANTFGTIAREFFAEHKVKGQGARPRRWRADARLLGLRWPLGADPAKDEPQVIGGSLAATWGDKPLAEIDGHNIHTVVDDARKRGIPGLARYNKGSSDARGRKMHAALSNLFRWALQHRKVTINPTVGVWHPGAPPPRERVLTNAEVVAFWKACERIDQPYGAIFKLLLLTAARLNEVAGMRRDELSEDGSVWTLPGERTKNHRPLVLALPPLARSIIGNLPIIEGSFVFTVSGRRAVTSWTLAKAALDKVMGATKPWRLHDLRRTAATGMAELGILPHVIEAVLNHVSGFKGGVAGIYNRATYAEEKKTALERWAAHIDGFVHERAAKVTPIRSAANK